MDLSNLPSDPMNSWWPYIISIIVGLITCLRSYMGGNSCPNNNRIDGKIVVITGASSGIGLQTAKELALRGGQIIMCCRNIASGKEAMKIIRAKNKKADITLKIMDLCSRQSIEDFVKCLGGFRVDILINNAGVTLHPYKKTVDGHDIHIATNYLGHFLLTHLLLENLKLSTQGRVINVASGAFKPISMPLDSIPEKQSYSPKEWFAQSKLAVIMMTQHFAKMTKGTNITINAVTPGLVRGTLHNRHSFVMNRWSVRASLAPWMWIFMKSPQQGSQTSVYLATDFLISGISGKFYNDCVEEMIPEHAADEDAAENLYKKTCKLLNLEEHVYKKAAIKSVDN